jgi:Helitron helicase-like domain at N-terminus
VSQVHYYAFRFQDRDGVFLPILHAGRLFQEYVVDAWVCCESNNLNLPRTHQNDLRTECYTGLQDALAAGLDQNGQQLGCRIILPSTVTGSPRQMKRLYQDAMAICRHYGRPDFFITFTCNPRWEEIMANLPPGFSASDRPDIVARVFNFKLKELLTDLCDKHVLGKPVADVYTIEFQKRGLPHAHILLILQRDDKIRDVEFLHDIICAEIPDRNLDPDLYDVITSNMMHGPCGPMFPTSPCMKNGPYCTKKYPWNFCDETTTNEDGYPLYRRRHRINGEVRQVKVKGVMLDNRWVIPYNPYLSKRFKAHNNVELCSSISTIKYVFKYVFKGTDRTAML